MLQSLRLRDFRGFHNFSLSFRNATYLVGPNNAGKSTIISALRIVESQLRFASSKSPDLRITDGYTGRTAYGASLDEFAAIAESVRFDFGRAESRIQLKWAGSSSCNVVWPEAAEEDDDDPPAHFFLADRTGVQPSRPAEVRQAYPSLGIVPPLGPVENVEQLLSEKYVRANVSGRLSSRHLRNQLWLMERAGKFSEFRDFVNMWTDEIQLAEVALDKYSNPPALDVFYTEGRRRHEREIAWAGDGIQVWLQILYHLHRTQDEPTIVLDEPEVFLHPDLQRRLVQLLEQTGRQIIVATHSSELLGDVAAQDVVLLDRTLSKPKRIKDDSGLAAIADQIGSRFNLRLAKALKSRVVVFVEGYDDVPMLSRTARVLELVSVTQAVNIAFVEMDGFDAHKHVEAFAWLCKDLLKDSVVPFVLLDRDYRTDAVIEGIERQFKNIDVVGHVWRRKELENYYLVVETIARVAGLTDDDVRSEMMAITEEMRFAVYNRLLSFKVEAEVAGDRDRITIGEEYQGEFEKQWTDLGFRLARCPGKEVLASFNRRQQSAGRKAISFRAIASSQTSREVPQEMRELLETISAAASEA